MMSEYISTFGVANTIFMASCLLNQPLMVWGRSYGNAARSPSLQKRGISICSSKQFTHVKENKQLLHATAQKEAFSFSKKGQVPEKTIYRRVFLPLVAAILVLSCPNTRSIQQHPDNIAYAQPMSQIRQAIMFLERLGEKPSGKILDKMVTVISGQTLVTPDMVDELKSIIEDEGGAHDWKADLMKNLESFPSTIIELASKFNPQTITEFAGAGIQGVLEAVAERFAAFEFSTLLALGERYLIWAPFLVLPMYWKMLRSKNIEEKYREGIQDVPQLTEQAAAKAERVRRELERIGVKAHLLDAVSLLSKSPKQEEELKRRHIEDLMLKLSQLNPLDISCPKEDANILSQGSQIDSLSATTAVHGVWHLIYISQADQKIERQYFLGFPHLNIPGVELSNTKQHIWQKPVKQDNGSHQMMARNTTDIRLGFLGVWKLSSQGSLLNLEVGRSLLVSFDTVTLQAIEFLGIRILEDLPSLNIPIPRALQTTGKWEVVYLDESLRINRGMGQLSLFQKL